MPTPAEAPVRRPRSIEVTIGEDEIRFSRYPFFPASVRSLPAVSPPMIGEIDLSAAPFAVRLKRELLFVPWEFREELHHFARRHAIPVRTRFDVWSAILEEFLDTEFDEVHREQTLAALEAHGVPRTETFRVRSRLERRMIWHTALTWEWQYYGLTDALHVMQPVLLGRAGYRRFYAEAMDLALRSYRT